MTQEEWNKIMYPNSWSKTFNQWGSFLSGIPVIGPMFGNMQNYNSQQAQLEYTKWAQQMSWDREDNAVQRRVADLRAAGLSPTLAAGSSAQTMSPVRTEAPQVDTNVGNQLLSALQGIENIKNTKEQTKLVQLQQERQRIDNMYRGEVNPLKVQEQEMDNYLQKYTVEHKVAIVRQAEKMGEMKLIQEDLDNQIKKFKVTEAEIDVARKKVALEIANKTSEEVITQAEQETMARALALKTNEFAKDYYHNLGLPVGTRVPDAQIAATIAWTFANRLFGGK